MQPNAQALIAVQSRCSGVSSSGVRNSRISFPGSNAASASSTYSAIRQRPVEGMAKHCKLKIVRNRSSGSCRMLIIASEA